LVRPNAEIQIIEGSQASLGIQAGDGRAFHQHRLHAARSEARHHSREAAPVKGRLETMAIVGVSKADPGRRRPERRVAHAPPAQGSGLGSEQAHRDPL
jgi:hypothetical protein